MYAVQIYFDGEYLALPRRFPSRMAALRAAALWTSQRGLAPHQNPFRIETLDSRRSGELQPNPTDPTDALTVN